MWFTDACEYMDVPNNPFYGGSASSSGGGSARGSGVKGKSSAGAVASGASGGGGAAGGAALLFVSRSDGYVSLIDFRMSSGSRTGSRFGYAWTCDMGYKVQSVQHWPTDEHLLLTANAGSGEATGSSAGTMNVWDIRYLSTASATGSSSDSGSKSQKLPATVATFAGHAKSINAAYASPDGKYVLSVSQDNTIRCWDVQHAVSVAAGRSGKGGGGSGSNGGKKPPAKATQAQAVPYSSTAHDNHTGRWLSTFRPTWDPKGE